MEEEKLNTLTKIENSSSEGTEPILLSREELINL